MKSYPIVTDGREEKMPSRDLFGVAGGAIRCADDAIVAIEAARRELAPDAEMEAEELDTAILQLERAYVALCVLRQRMPVASGPRWRGREPDPVIGKIFRWWLVWLAALGIGMAIAWAKNALGSAP